MARSPSPSGESWKDGSTLCNRRFAWRVVVGGNNKRSGVDIYYFYRPRRELVLLLARVLGSPSYTEDPHESDSSGDQTPSK